LLSSQTEGQVGKKHRLHMCRAFWKNRK